MKRGVLVIICVVFALVCLISNLFYYNGIENCIVAEVKSNQNIERISLWAGNDNKVYLFLPSYADLLSTKLILTKRADIVLDGKCIDGAIECGAYQLDTPYELTFRSYGRELNYKLIFVKSANVATMYINTESGSMDYIHGEKRNSEAGEARVYLSDGRLEAASKIKSISGRGNTTWDNTEKKPYIIDFGQDVDLLGMGAARDWVLLANSNDPSNMRNIIVYDFARKAGLPYSPEAQWMDVYLNGDYAGLYLVSEQNEVHKERVDIEGENSFLVSLERRGRIISQSLPYVETENKQILRVRYLKEETEEKMSELTQVWQNIENAILHKGDEDGIKENDWQELIDINSWAGKYLIEEVFGNLDAGFISQFFFYNDNDEKGKVYAGPVWDYDLSMSRTWQTANIDFMIANRLVVSDEFTTPWFHELYNKEEFFNKIKEIFQTQYLPLLYDLCEETIDKYDEIIAKASSMNELRWNTKGYEAEVELICDYLKRRIEFLKRLWIEEKEYHTIEARSEGASYAYFAVEDGMCAEHLPVIESSATRTFMGWYDENGEPFDINQPIYEDAVIYARWDGLSATITGYAQYFIPLAIIACMGVGVLIADIRRGRKGG